MRNPKPQPNDALYLEVLRRMTPDQRLRKAFELTEFSRQLFRDGLRRLHPQMSEPEFHRLYLEHLARCHNNNY